MQTLPETLHARSHRFLKGLTFWQTQAETAGLVHTCLHFDRHVNYDELGAERMGGG